MLFGSVFAKRLDKRHIKVASLNMERRRNVNEGYEKRGNPPPPAFLPDLTLPMKQNIALVNNFVANGNMVGGLKNNGPNE
ncbi:hypothetical protein INT48_001794 [Thamnidium elegans]|uniref:Uncharacterized protein n=1 Tax=Thamnidium elegans TaxID=101142 RepID=A0A8H7SZE8_9FUNG|nr:hypothetical protein INT48_001794 [Thamnidium elegans]